MKIKQAINKAINETFKVGRIPTHVTMSAEAYLELILEISDDELPTIFDDLGFYISSRETKLIIVHSMPNK